MKNKDRLLRKTALLILSVLLITPVFAQWKLAPNLPPTMSGLTEVVFPAENAAYLCGYEYVYKSNDGGLSWQSILDKGPFANFNNLLFINADTGFVNLYGTIYRTLDGGINWNSISGNHSQALKESDGALYTSYVSNDTTYIIKSTNLGDQWTTIYKNHADKAQPYLFSFIDSQNGYFIDVNHPDRVLKTNDGCITMDTIWITTGDIIPQAQFDFLNSEHGYLYGSWGSQSDPSMTWNTGTFYFPIDLDGFGVLPVLDLCLKASNLYASNLYGKIFVSKDYGQRWTQQQTPSTDPIYSIAFLDDKRGIAVSENKLFYTINNGLSNKNQNSIKDQMTICPNPAGDYFRIDGNVLQNIKKVQIVDINGRLIREYSGNSNLFRTDGIKSGVYIVKITSMHAEPISKKLIIN